MRALTVTEANIIEYMLATDGGDVILLGDLTDYGTIVFTELLNKQIQAE